MAQKKITNNELNSFLLLNEMTNVLRPTKNACILVDYQLPSGDYKWKDIYVGMPEKWSDKDIIENLSEIMRQSGVSTDIPIRIGLVAVSYDFFDTDKISAVQEAFMKSGVIGKETEEIIKHFKILFFDATY